MSKAVDMILAGKDIRKSLIAESKLTEGEIIEIHPGDMIAVGHEKATVKDILFQDVYVASGSDYKKSAADVEFKDENDNYRHWQSWSDGGTLKTMDGQVYKFEKE